MSRVCHVVVVVPLLLLAGCAVIGDGGSGVASPFFDDASRRTTGVVDGWVFVPRQSDSPGGRSLTFAPYPLDPTVYVEASAVGITLGGQRTVTDSRGFYTFDKVAPGDYEIRATDTTGAFADAAGPIQVRKAAITSGLSDPVDPPYVPSAEYFRVGRQDVIRYTSLRGSVEWRWADTVTVGGSGAFRMSFAPPGAAVDDAFIDLSFSDEGVLLHGTEDGWLDPPTPIAPLVMAPGSRFDRSAELVSWDDGNGAEPWRRPVYIVGELSDVDDLVLPAGRFDNCPRFDVSVYGEGVAIEWQIWLAYRIGPVKIIKDSIDHQASYMQIGGKTYPD